jgi:hypothetical protein
MPLDELGMLDHFNGIDANGIEENRISGPNVKDSCNHTADICANFDNAFHILDFTKTFDGGFDRLAMRFDKVKLSLVSGNLLGIAISIDFLKIVLSNETQNSNRVGLVVQGFKIVAEKVGTKEGRSNNL